MPKEVKNWTNKQKMGATKNLLQDRTCENCLHNTYCLRTKNEYNTCYLYEEKLISVKLMEKPSGSIFKILLPIKEGSHINGNQTCR